MTQKRLIMKAQRKDSFRKVTKQLRKILSTTPKKGHKLICNTERHDKRSGLRSLRDVTGQIHITPTAVKQVIRENFEHLATEVGPPKQGQYGDCERYRQYPWAAKSAVDAYSLSDSPDLDKAEEAKQMMSAMTDPQLYYIG
jgi:hypothetical protein